MYKPHFCVLTREFPLKSLPFKSAMYYHHQQIDATAASEMSQAFDPLSRKKGVQAMIAGDLCREHKNTEKRENQHWQPWK